MLSYINLVQQGWRVLSKQQESTALRAFSPHKNSQLFGSKLCNAGQRELKTAVSALISIKNGDDGVAACGPTRFLASQNLTGAARKWMTSRPMYFRMTRDLPSTVGACAFSVDNDPSLVVDEIEKEAALVPPLFRRTKALLRLISLNTRQQLFL